LSRQPERQKRTTTNEGEEMNTEESVAWFRAKNARRKQEQQTLSSKELHRRRTERRNMPNGAFGKKEDQNVVTDSTDVD
jgi:hypothetical protein